jgi:hypothetical protein
VLPPFVIDGFEVIMNEKELDEIMIDLINRSGIKKSLASIIRVCGIAHKNYPQPAWGWDSDKDAISRILPEIKN